MLPATAPPALPPKGIECRAWPRLVCDVLAKCQPAAARSREEPRWPGTIRDVSRGGLGLVLGRRFEPGTALFVELGAAGGEDRRPLLARVVHVKRLGGGAWLLGCAFASRLGDDELRLLLALGGPAPSA
jgi:PilZ domain